MHFHKRLIAGFVVLGAGLVGCSSETPTAQQSPAADASATSGEQGANQTSSQAAAVPPPTDVVSRFLDQIRRGGAQTEAGALMTTKAQAECKRTGLVVQPLGSPETHFEVTRSEFVPGTKDAALVHSMLTEPPLQEGAEPASYQVVWALRLEPAGWRISGLALEVEAGQEPLVVDFENGNDAARKLGVDIAATPANEPTEQQAAEPPKTEVR